MIIIAFILSVIAILNKRNIIKVPFSPWNCTILVWMVVSYLSFFLQKKLFEAEWSLYISLLLWIFGFCLSSISFFNLFFRDFGKKIVKIKNNGDANHFGIMILHIATVLLLPFYAYAYFKNIGPISPELLFDIRDNAVHGEVNLVGISFVPSMCKALLIFESCNYSKKRKGFFFLSVLENVVAASVILEKGYFVMIFIISAYSIHKKGFLKRKNVLALSFVVFMLLFLMNKARSIFDQDNNGILEFISLYVVSPSIAFGTLQPNSSPYFGAHTFRFAYAVLNALGMGPEVVSNWFDPVYVPVKTNVFTVMEPFYHDFGYFGILLFSIVSGAISSGLYYLSQKYPGTLFLGLYSYLLSMLILQFFQEYFFTSFSVTVQILFFLLLSAMLSKMIGHYSRPIRILMKRKKLNSNESYRKPGRMAKESRSINFSL